MLKEKFDVVIPCFNEAVVLEKNALRLLRVLSSDFGENFTLTIADNASTDASLEIAKKLAGKFPQLRIVHLREKGRGIALKKAWLSSKCDFLAYTDADLSYNPKSLKIMFKLLQKNDVVNASRYITGSEIKRFAFRGFLSRLYIVLVKLLFPTKLSDFQAGMKGIRKDFAVKILPKVNDAGFFFDTELLLRSEKAGAGIAEFPCFYNDLRKSSVKAFSTSINYVFNLLRLRFEV